MGAAVQVTSVQKIVWSEPIRIHAIRDAQRCEAEGAHHNIAIASSHIVCDVAYEGIRC